MNTGRENTGLRQSSRLGGDPSAKAGQGDTDGQACPGGPVGRKHRFSEASESDGTPTTLSLRQRNVVKRMKREEEDEGSQTEQVDRPRRGSSLGRHKGKPSSVPKGKMKSRGRRRNERVPVRRSMREKRLVFASLNISEMDRQLFNPESGYPMIEDSSEDELDPYEKMLSPHRSRRKVHQSSTPSTVVTSHGDVGQEGMTLRSASNQLMTQGEGKEEEEQNGEEEEGEREREGEEEEEEEEEEDSGSEEEEEGERGYFLRKRRPVIYQYQPVIQVVEEDTPPKRRSKRPTKRDQPRFYRPNKSGSSQGYTSHRQPRIVATRKRAVHDHGSSTSSSGSDSDEARFRRRKSRSMQKARRHCLPMNFAPDDITQTSVRDRIRIGASLADIDPMSVDRDVTFESVGGLRHHIRALKEMIIFPLLYPEVFDRFKIQPPRGVLFYGAPGCGKTLVARALANECSKGGKKVAFFMRKGADCLSKWVGESERQLRLLFDQAYQVRPSIIFFDEIDGLAPVRSSRQDQIHSSIVSTLLALMDGLDSRGEVVVIGATNRIDAIDPALRRPGRFDREFLFPLPSREDRLSILQIHTKAWHPPLKPDFLSELADSTVGYCGADIKGLCTEAALHALRRHYPQIYQTADKLVLDVSTISVAAADFHHALKAVVPTAQRSETSPACVLSETVQPVLVSQFHALLSFVSFVFPPSWKAVDRAQRELQRVLALEEGRCQQIRECVAQLQKGDSCLSMRSGSAGEPASLSSAVSPPVGSRSEMGSSSGARSHTGGSQSADTALHNHNENFTSPPNSEPFFSASMPSVLDGGQSTQHRQQSNLFNQLYVSRQLPNIDEVFFDLSEVSMEGSQPSILMETSVSGQSLGNSASADSQAGQTGQRFLSHASHPHAPPTPHCPRVLICGDPGMGQTRHLAPALLHALEEIPVKVLDLSALFAVSTKAPEEACAQVFREARRVAPSIVYVPRISSLWEVTNEAFRATFLSLLLSLTSPVLVVGTAEAPWSSLPRSLQEIFIGLDNDSFTVRHPSLEERQRFFFNVLLQKPLQSPPPKPSPLSEVPMESLPVAQPPEPCPLTEQEVVKVKRQREAVLRELRVFLREVTNKLLAERKFKELAKRVNPEEVPDYYNIITEPMDLGTVMKKIDEHRYSTPKQWLADIDLITRNALEYNPEHDSESRLLRHRAVALQDMAHSILDHELSEDFEKQCEDVEESHRMISNGSPSQSSSRPVTGNPTQYTGKTAQTSQYTLSSTNTPSLLAYDAPRRSLRRQGILPIVEGLPYYAPARPRTPKKQDELNTKDGPAGHDESQSSTLLVEGLEMSVPANDVDKDERDQNGYPEPQVMALEGDSSAVSMEMARSEGNPFSQESEDPSKLSSCNDNIPSTEHVTKKLNQSSVKRQLWDRESATPPEESEDALGQSDRPSTTGSSGCPRRRSVRLSSQCSQSAIPHIPSPSMDSAMDTSQPPSQPPSQTDPDGVRASRSSSKTSIPTTLPVSIDCRRLLSVFERVVGVTGHCALREMEMLHSTISQLVFRHRMQTDRHQLLEDLELVVEVFSRHHCTL